MKLSIQANDLANVLKHVCRVSIRASGDINGHLLLNVTDAGVLISATNGKQQITMKLDSPSLNVEALGAICVHAAKLEQVIGALPKDKAVSVSIKDEKLLITCGRSRFNLVTLAAFNFPAVDFPDAEIAGSLRLGGSLLSAALRQVGFCAARNDVRHYLNGALFDVEPGCLTIVATDGHRLGVTEVNVATTVTGKFILPSTCIEDVVGFCGSGEIEVAFSRNMVRYTNQSGVLFSRLLEGNFPSYKNLVTNAAQGQVARLVRNDIASAVARVTLMSDSKNPAVKLSLVTDVISIQSVSVDIENEANDVLPCNYSAEPFEIGMNGVLAAELLRALGSEEVEFIFNGAASGTLLRSPSFPSHSFVLMPVRL